MEGGEFGLPGGSYIYMACKNRRERVARLASSQQGRITVRQLHELGVTPGSVQRWIADGYLIRVLPAVYAVGHMGPNRKAELWAAVLYAGPGAALSHATAAAQLGLLDIEPTIVEVSTPRDVRTVRGVLVYRRPQLTREFRDGLPITPAAQTIVDLAAVRDARIVRRALAQLDYRRQLDVNAVRAVCQRGRRGSARLREALASYEPKLAYANGRLEEEFLEWCGRCNLPAPLVNARVHGFMVDAYWPDAGLVVELDGYSNHATPAQRRRDYARDLQLRGHGLTVLRYDWELFRTRKAEVRAEIANRVSVGDQSGRSRS